MTRHLLVGGRADFIHYTCSDMSHMRHACMTCHAPHAPALFKINFSHSLLYPVLIPVLVVDQH